MNLAISNLAWKPAAEDEAVAHLLNTHGFGGVELAPTKIWPDLTKVTEDEAGAYRKFWNDRGIQVVAMQALLFGRDDLTIFGSQEKRDEGVAYFEVVFRIARWLGARPLVYGSPKHRRGVDGRDPRILDTAAVYFHRLGALARRYEVCLCIEPLPVSYPCEFLTDTREALEFVKRVDDPGFGLHVDASSLFAGHEDIEDVIEMASGSIQHFHASEPRFEPVRTDGPVPLQKYFTCLRRAGYARWVSVEMLEPNAGGSNLEAIEATLRDVREAVSC